MPAFIPAGLLTLHVGLGRAAQTWFSERWAKLSVQDYELFEAASDGDWRQTRFRYSRPYLIAKDVFDRIRPLAANGSLPTLMRMPDGGPVPVAPEAWLSRSADNFDVILKGTASLRLGDGTSVAGPILVRIADLDAVLRGEPAPSLHTTAPVLAPVSALPPAAARRRAGRPTKAGADEFWIEVCRRMMAGDGQAGQAKLTKMLADWASENMSDPYNEETVRKKLGRLFGALGTE